jgi:multicomponent Na+:H+ antiporter subunit F
MSGEITVTGTAVMLTFVMLLLGMVCAFVRIVRGPSLADRVVALDMLTMLMVAFAGVYVVATGEPAFLDVAIALALIGFLATVAFARYAERRERQPADGTADKE